MNRIEWLRTHKMRSGPCELCGKVEGRLERHHLQYEPEVTIQICHACHHRIHFYPQEGPVQWRAKIVRKLGEKHPEWDSGYKEKFIREMHPVGKRGMK